MLLCGQLTKNQRISLSDHLNLSVSSFLKEATIRQESVFSPSGWVEVNLSHSVKWIYWCTLSKFAIWISGWVHICTQVNDQFMAQSISVSCMQANLKKSLLSFNGCLGTKHQKFAPVHKKAIFFWFSDWQGCQHMNVVRAVSSKIICGNVHSTRTAASGSGYQI